MRAVEKPKNSPQINGGNRVLLETSGDVIFNSTPSRSQLFISIPIPAPRFSEVVFL